MPMPSTTEKAKKALSPMPGAWAIGKRASSPITSEPKAAASAVAVNTASRGMPSASASGPALASESTLGFTNRM